MSRFLSTAQWRARQCSHVARLLPFIEAHRARRSRGEKHAVWDFLWEYYSFRPAQLLKWSPGIGVELESEESFGGKEFDGKEWKPTDDGFTLDLARFPLHRLESVRAVLTLLEQTAAREPFHGCFGLHEWAMVYRGDRRHASPLRLSGDAIADLVESQVVRCSHYDAFRFFSAPAVALNVLQPQADNRAEFEQPGCIHASMDLYKWAYKFAPWISADLVADCFDLARAARWLDMRAAPYDLAAYDVPPILLETPAGRREYASQQSAVAARAAPLRARLIEEYRALICAVAAS